MNKLPTNVVTDDKSFVRDTRNRALLNTDKAALDRHRASRSKAKTLVKRLDILEAEVAYLKRCVDQLTWRA
jgi:hypothetical protein